MAKKSTSLSTILDSPILSRIIVGIGETSEITGVSARQLRYWETKGIIRAIGDNDSTNRRYDYPTIEKIVLLKDFLDQGFTLESAAKRLEERIQQLNKTILKLSNIGSLKKSSRKDDGNDSVFIGYATHRQTKQRFKIYSSLNEREEELIAESVDSSE